VDSKCHWDVPVPIDLDNVVVKYGFSCVGGDIGFGVSFSGRDGSETDLQPVDRVAAHQSTISGTISAPSKGIVTLRFDNTYSWFVSKEIQYSIEVCQVSSS